MSSPLNVDELLPPAQSLVALQFDSREEFLRGRALLWEHPDCFQWLDRRSSVIVVQRADLSRFASAGLRYTEREVVDGTVELTAEESDRMRRWMHEMNTRMLRGLSLDP